jgi:death-on-curing protein
MRGIIADHPFYDGNKRTGTLAGLTLLELNNLRVAAVKGEIEDFAVQVAVEHLMVEQISAWLQAHTV